MTAPLLQRAQALGIVTPAQAQELLRLAQQQGQHPDAVLQRHLSPEVWARVTGAAPSAPESFGGESFGGASFGGASFGAGFDGGFGLSPGTPSPQAGADRFDEAPTLRPDHFAHASPGSFDDAPTLLGSSSSGSGSRSADGQTLAASAGPGRRWRPEGRVGDFELVRELARGGMGIVYVARSPGLDRQVALKLLLEESSTAQGFERFRTEARTAARLKHPNIVGIHHVGEEEGNPYLVMDLIQGRSLDEVVRDEGPLEPEEAARITRDLAGALAYAHQLAVLHRDLKPHNVILREDGTPILTDFGLAKDVEAEGLTVTGQVLGTPAYMPPEQAGGELESVDRRADVYGLGATLYHLLTGGAPFAGETYEILTAVLLRDPEPPSALRPGIDRDLDTICLKCLEKDAGDRYRTMGELEADLAAYLADQPISARPPNLGERLAKWRRRNPALAKVIVLAGLLLVAGGVFAALRIQSVDRSARQAEQARLVGAAAEVAGEARAALAALPLPESGAGAESERALEARSAAALQAFVTAERWHSLAPEDAAAARAVFEAACDLGQVNERSRQWLLAIQAYEAAATLPVDPEGAKAHVARARAAREREREEARAALEARRQAVRGALADAAEGRLQAKAFAFERAAFQVVRNLDSANLDLLCARLETIADQLAAAEAALWRRALGGQAQEVLSVLPRRKRGEWSSSDEVVWKKAARELERWQLRTAGTSARATTVIGSEQTRTLGGGEAAVARLILTALAQSEAPRARAALIRYLLAEQDAARATLAGRALCLGGKSSEVGPVIRLVLEHFGPSSPFSSEVVKVLGQLGELPQDLAREARQQGRDPDHPAQIAARVSLLQRQGQLQAALGLADRGLAKGDSVKLLVERSIVYRLMGRHEESFADANRACELAPRSMPARLARLFCLRELKRIEEGLAEADAILATNWRVTPAHLMRGAFLATLGRREEAIAAFGAAMKADPEEVEAYTNRALLYHQESEEAPEGRRRELLLAAERDLEVAQRLAPTNHQAISLRADLALAKGEIQRAVALLGQAIDRQPRDGFLYLQRARAKDRAGDRAGAERDGARALELGETGARPFLERLRSSRDERYTPRELYAAAERALAEGEVEKAQGVARTLQQAATNEWQGRGHTLQARIFLTRRQPREALVSAKRAIALLPQDPEPHHQAGLAFYFLGKLQRSVAAYTKALELKPEAAVVLTNRASSYVAGLRQHPEWADPALADLEATLRIDANQASAWGNLGMLKARRGDTQGAITALERSVQLAPEHPMTPRTRALIQKLRGR